MARITSTSPRGVLQMFKNLDIVKQHVHIIVKNEKSIQLHFCKIIRLEIWKFIQLRKSGKVLFYHYFLLKSFVT